ncbi:MAG: alyA7 [Fibrobacteres bacterium]|nr:alyA7 [Fibrobacterota bacterium]
MSQRLILFFVPVFSLAFTACDLAGSLLRDSQPGSSSDPEVAEHGALGKDEGVPLAKGANPFSFNADLEDQDAGCWGDRAADGYARNPCGNWGAIGPAAALLADGQASHSGNKSLRVTFDKNESRGGATLSLSADAVHVRAWYYFASDFDFGQGIKVGRIRSFNHATQANDIDIIMTVRSSGDADQCGLTDMADLGLFYNGKPAGYDWGHLIVPVKFARGRWYAVEYAVTLNTPGAKDGSVRVWVDGKEMGSKEGLNLRGKAGADTKLNKIMLGGWYSNSALRNDCADPYKPSTFYMDDIAVGSDFLGLD